MAQRVVAALLGVVAVLSGPAAASAEEVDGDGPASFEEAFFEVPSSPPFDPIQPYDRQREGKHLELQTEELRARIQERRARIQDDLDARDSEVGARWAGRYLGSNGFAWARLDVGPDGSFVYQAGGCTGTSHVAWGHLDAVGDSRFRVAAEFERSVGGEALGDLVRHPSPDCDVLAAERDLPDLGSIWRDGCPRGEDPRILIGRIAEDPA